MPPTPAVNNTINVALNSLVSIIIPTYNRSWGLAHAMRSVLAQTYQNYELLVVDDCSQDDTPAVVASFSDERISYYRQPVNVGMVKNWGEVLRLAHGELIVFLSDDDQLRPEFVANRVKHMASDHNIIVVFSKFDVRDLSGKLLKIQNQNAVTEKDYDASELLRAALSREWFVGTSMYRKSAIEKVWDRVSQDDLVLDLGLNVRLAARELGRGVYIPSNDFVMTSHSGQNSQAKRVKVYEQVSQTLERILGEEKSKCLWLIKKELASWHLVWGRYLAAQGEIREARSHFLRALLVRPVFLSAWKQFGGALIMPGRVVNASRKQHSSPTQSV